jgi:parallel beta-helix repeat protein
MVEKRLVVFSLLFLAIVTSGCEEPQQSPFIPLEGDCIIPTDGMVITEDTVFCFGIYDLPNGININSVADISLNCNGAILRGTGSNVGLSLTGTHRSTIISCRFMEYRRGINLMQSSGNQFIANEVTDSVEMGVTLALSNGNVFIGNEITVGNGAGMLIDYESNDNVLIENNICGGSIDLQCVNSFGNLGNENNICVLESDEGCYADDAGLPSGLVIVDSVSSESLYPGNKYTISGYGFGYKTPAEPVLWDTISNQEAYNGLTHGDTIPAGYGYPWAANGMLADPNDDNVKYWDQNNRVNGRSHYYVEDIGFLAGRDLGEMDPKELYINWWFKVDKDIYELPVGETCYTEDQTFVNDLKTRILRVWPRYDSNGYLRYGLINLEGSRLGRGATSGEVSPPCVIHDSYDYPEYDYFNWDDAAEEGEWHNLEMFVDSNDYDRGVGEIYAKTDGLVMYEGSNFCSGSPNNLLRAIGVIPDHPECFDQIYGEPLRAEYSEIYVDKSIAKIFICDVPTWGERPGAHCEIQIPETHWGEDSIQFRANRGSHRVAQPLYLYVVGTSGAVNQAGYPISFTKSLPGEHVEVMETPIGDDFPP